MAENVKVVEKRNPEEKAPEKEHFQHIKDVIHRLHRKRGPEPEVETLGGMLKRIDDDWKSGLLGKGADAQERLMEKWMKDFKKHEKLTKEMRGVVEKVGRYVLSEDEAAEAKDRLAGARYIYSIKSTLLFSIRGANVAEYLEILRKLDPKASNYEKVHESAHCTHFFVRMKQLESGKIEDPVVKKLYDYLHNSHNNTVIWALERYYIPHEYGESIANAISFNILGAKNMPANPGVLKDVLFAKELIHEDPKKLRKLMENPSMWVEADSMEDLVKRLNGASNPV
jgi:hypothetical protein